MNTVRDAMKILPLVVIVMVLFSKERGTKTRTGVEGETS